MIFHDSWSVVCPSEPALLHSLHCLRPQIRESSSHSLPQNHTLKSEVCVIMQHSQIPLCAGMHRCRTSTVITDSVQPVSLPFPATHTHWISKNDRCGHWSRGLVVISCVLFLGYIITKIMRMCLSNWCKKVFSSYFHLSVTIYSWFYHHSIHSSIHQAALVILFVPQGLAARPEMRWDGDYDRDNGVWI